MKKQEYIKQKNKIKNSGKDLTETKISSLSIKEFTVMVIKMLRRTTNEQTKNFNRDRKCKCQVGVTELKNTITKLKNTVEGLNTKVNEAQKYQ